MTARILIVEDDSAQRRLLARVLIACGFVVAEASSVAEGVAAPGRFDLLLLDWRLGDGFAPDVVAGRGPGERVLAVSGYDRPRDYLGAWLRKPYGNGDVTGAVRRILAEAHI